MKTKDPNKVWVIVNVDGKRRRISMAETLDYYARENLGARDIFSGCRRLGELVGDGRPIDEIAQHCLDELKTSHLAMLRAEGRKLGMEPRF